MYPFERFNKVLKSYVRNRFYPEGCIAETYLGEESIEFFTEFVRQICTTAGLPKDKGKLSGPQSTAIMKSVDEKERDEGHLHVLLNNSEVYPYITDLHKLAKKQKRSNLRLTNGNNSMEKQVEEKSLTSQPENIGEAKIAAPEATDAPCGDVQQASGPQTPVTSIESKKKINGGVRGVCVMHKVVMKRAQGKKFKIRCNKLGIPMVDERDKLQSYLGMLARIMVPINIPSWPEVDPNLKSKILDDIRKKKLRNPPKKYAYVGKDAWRKFVATRSSESWESLSKEQSQRVSERKYPHRTSRKGYIGLEEEEVKAGRLEPDEIPVAAIFWKIARTPPEGTVIDNDLKETFERIDDLIEKKRKGEFIPHGTYFKLPKGKDKRTRITKAEFEQTKNEFEQTKMEFMSQIAELKSELKAVVTASKLQSPISDKASYGVRENEEEPRKCELAVDNIENVVVFGMVFPQDGMSSSVHGVPLQPGYVRVQVDGIIKEDALVQVPIAGEIETIVQAISSLLAWPEDMVIFTPVTGRNLETEVRKRKHSEMFAFLDPSATFKLNDDFQNYIIAMMRSGASRIFLMPHNEG
ncbi:hypothetical protein AgCh_011634 [Apium graveolens]